MDVSTITFHNLPAGDDTFSLGVYSTKELAKEAIRRFISDGGYEYKEEEEPFNFFKTTMYYDCIKNPQCPENLDLHYTAEIETYTIDVDAF